MESNTSRSENIVAGDELDIDNLMDRFAEIGHHDISQESVDSADIVKFDLDTTDLSKSKEICRISARCNDNVFDRFILPNMNISDKSSAINKLKILQIGNERKLFLNRTEVNSVSPREGLTAFLDFLREQSDRKVLLAAHNCFTFDGLTLIREMLKYDLLDACQSCVLGLIDTLRVFKLMLPTRIEERKSFDLPTLAEDYEIEGSSFPEGQNAEVNVKILDLLITRIGCTDEILKQHAKKLTVFIQSMPENVKARTAGLALLGNAVTPTMKTTMAKAGISMEKLIDVYGKRGDVGISRLLQEDIGGKPRVTNRQGIIESIIAVLSALSLANPENGVAN